MQLPSVAIVILNWNGHAFLQKFLPSVVATIYPNFKIYIADNASTDDSLFFVTQTYPQISVLVNSGNLGFAGGYNEALQKIKADYYVLLNQDVAVDKNWLHPVIELLESDPQIGACQPKIRSYRQPEYFEYAGAAGGWMDRYGYMFCKGRIFRSLEVDRGQYDSSDSIFWASGAALFIRAQLYHEAGGLDQRFFAHMEEIDLCWRLQRMGYLVKACPQSLVYHVGGGSLPQGNPRKVYLNYRNNLLLLYKNLHPAERNKVLFLRRLLDGVAALKSLFSGNWAEIKSIWRAHHDFKALQKYYSSQENKFSFFRLQELKGVYQGSIVWDYFLRKKKKFSSLSENSQK